MNTQTNLVFSMSNPLAPSNLKLKTYFQSKDKDKKKLEEEKNSGIFQVNLNMNN